MTVEQKKRKEQAIQYFISQGYAPHVAAAIVGNLIHESGLKTEVRGDLDNPQGDAVGIAQWRLDRQKNLKNNYGKNWNKFENQLEFVHWELQNTEKLAGEKLKTAKTVEEAGEIFSDLYERPKVKYKQDKNRQARVNEAFKSINPSFTNLDKAQNISTFAQELQPKTEVQPQQEEETEELEPEIQEAQQKVKEYSFLKDIEELYQLPPQQQVQLTPQETAMPTIDVLGTYEQASQIVDNPVMQQGGTWEKQKEDLRQEKLEQLRQLKNQPKPQYTAKEKIQLLNETKKDNTRVVINNDPSKISKVARNKTDQEIAEERQFQREQAENNPLNQGLGIVNPNNWSRENWAETAKGLESQFRVSDEPNFFDDYINPANMIGGMAANLGQAPLQAEQSDSFMPYFTAVGAPLVVGATAGLGAKTTGQFVNNLANPLAGTGDLVNSLGNKVGNVPNYKKVEDLINYFNAEDKFKKLPKTTNEKVISTIEEFKKRIGTEEGKKRLKNLGITEEQVLKDLKGFDDLDDYAYYRQNKVVVNPNLPYHSQSTVTRHEIEHGVQEALMQSRMKEVANLSPMEKLKVLEEGHLSDIDKSLSNLELRKEGSGKVWDKTNKQEVDVNSFYSKLSDKQNATDYFLTGSSGKEKSAFLAEVQQYMLDRGIVKNAYDEITPSMVKQTMADAIFDEKTGGKYLRLFNIIKPTDGNYKLISENLNKMLSLVPITGAAYLANQETTQFQQGGIPTSPNGLYDYPNQPVLVNTKDGKITMKNIDYEVLGIDEFGNKQLMQPNKEYQFKGKNILEIPTQFFNGKK